MSVVVEVGGVHGEAIVDERVYKPVEQNIKRLEEEKRTREKVSETLLTVGWEWLHWGFGFTQRHDWRGL
jgi:hypothetical protein